MFGVFHKYKVDLLYSSTYKMPSDYSGDTYVNSVKCRTCLSLVLQTKQTLPLTFLPLSVPDFAYILFPLDPVIRYWSHLILNTKLQCGTVARTTEETGSCLHEYTSCCVCFVLLWGEGSSKYHSLTLWSFIVTVSIIHICISCPLLQKKTSPLHKSP